MNEIACRSTGHNHTTKKQQQIKVSIARHKNGQTEFVPLGTCWLGKAAIRVAKNLYKAEI